jgi:hypothetical protein
MSPGNVQYFLIIYDIPSAKAEVESFGSDYSAALAKYSETENEHRDDENLEVVLLGSDSAETLRRTHSSYFELSERHLDRVVARELAAHGLR